MENPSYEGAPDDYGVTDWVSNAFNDRNLKRNEAIRAVSYTHLVASPSNRYVNGKFAHTDGTMYSADL